jgi:hypothetical protein
MIGRGFAPIAPVRGILWFQLAATASGLAARAMNALRRACRPSGVAGGVVADLTRSRPELILENALLRQQLIVASRSVKRARFRGHERGLLVLLARLLPRWRGALLLVKPQTVLRWHRAALRLLWRRKSRSAASREPRMAPDVIALIRCMAIENRLWGAERIRGELLKLRIRVAKRTVQRTCAEHVHPHRIAGRAGPTFLRNHTVWACDFLQTYDVWFRPIFYRLFFGGLLPPLSKRSRFLGFCCAFQSSRAWAVIIESRRSCSTRKKRRIIAATDTSWYADTASKRSHSSSVSRMLKVFSLMRRKSLYVQ